MKNLIDLKKLYRALAEAKEALPPGLPEELLEVSGF